MMPPDKMSPNEVESNWAIFAYANQSESLAGMAHPNNKPKIYKFIGYIIRKIKHGKLIIIDVSDETGRLQCVGTTRNESLNRVYAGKMVEVHGQICKKPKLLYNSHLNLNDSTVELIIKKLHYS